MSAEIYFNSIPVYNNKFYTIDGIQYDIQFPKEWAINHMPNSGPLQCNDCRKYGKNNNNSFVSYCLDCIVKYKQLLGEDRSLLNTCD